MTLKLTKQLEYNPLTGESFSDASADYLADLSSKVNTYCDVICWPRKGIIKEFHNAILTKVTSDTVYFEDHDHGNELIAPHSRIKMIIFYPNRTQ